MIHIAIVENEINMSDQLESYLKKIEKDNLDIVFLIDVYHSATEFLAGFKAQYDLVLLDIGMPGMNGMDAAKMIREKDDRCLIIFVTYMAKFALKGYEVNAFDFIVKPVSYFSFSLKIQHAISNIIRNKNDYVMIKTSDGMRRIYVSSITYLEVSGHYLTIHTCDGELQSNISLSNMKKIFEPFYFLQCNVCYLVNPKHISLIAGDYVYIGKKMLKVSRSKKKIFLKSLADYIANFEGVKYE